MMTWNHRVIEFRHTYADGEVEVTQSINEVHYEDGKPVGYGDPFMCWTVSEGETWAKLLEQLQQAFDKPVLQATDFPQPEESEAAKYARLHGEAEAAGISVTLLDLDRKYD